MEVTTQHVNILESPREGLFRSSLVKPIDTNLTDDKASVEQLATKINPTLSSTIKMQQERNEEQAPALIKQFHVNNIMNDTI